MQNYNIILKTVDVSAGSSVTEPVSLADMKNYLRLQGFIDDNDSTSIDDFEDDDDLIEELISTARQSLEEMLGVSIVEHTWQAIVTNIAGMVKLEYGPVTEIVSIEEEDGTAYDETDEDIVKMLGDYLKIPRDCNMTVEYTAGFETVPSPIVTEIKRMVAHLYEHRGDEEIPEYQYSTAVLRYSRKEIIQ